MHFRALILYLRALTCSDPGSKISKIKPVSGEIVVVDDVGTKYLLGWRNIEIEMDEPATAGAFKITGLASVVLHEKSA